MQQQPPPPPERAQVDGVPVHFAELPGAFSAALMFRVGRSDEPLGCLGISHLVEHLALYALGNPAFAHNGFVDLTRTVFYASGSRDEVAGFLRGVCGALAGLPLERLEDERRVLRTEVAADDPGFYGRLLAYRFGAAGPGLVNYQDLGLNWLDADTVAGWAAERYTRGNAVMWMSGPPLEDLELQLPEGEGVAAAAPASLPCFSEPLYALEGTGGVGVSMVGRRSTELSCALRLAVERAVARVRIEQGLSYAAGSDYLPLDARHAHAILSADCLDDHAEKVLRELLAVLEEVGSGGAAEEELELDRRRIRDAMAEPDWLRAQLDRAATDELHGWPGYTAAQLLEEHEALTPATVGAALGDALATRLVVAPATIPPPAGHAPYPGATAAPVEGREFLPRRGLTGRRADGRVVAGDEGVTLLQSGEEPVTVRFESLVGAVRGAPGKLTLIARDGSFIEVTFSGLRDGDALEQLLADRLPAPGAVPGPGFEAASAVERIAARDLKRRWGVSDELEGLPGLLRDGEALEHLALAERGHRVGLLALTSSRVLWLYSAIRRGRDDVWEAPREKIADVRSWAGIPGIADARLRLKTPDGDLKLTGINPRDKLGDVVAALAVSSGSG